MEKQLPIVDPSADACEIHQMPVEGGALVYHQTPAGTWICCHVDGPPTWGRGLPLASAVANWERAQAFLKYPSPRGFDHYPPIVRAPTARNDLAAGRRLARPARRSRGLSRRY